VQSFVRLRRGNPGRLPPPVADFEANLSAGERRMLAEVAACSAVGSAETVRRGLEEFAARTGTDEIMVASHIYDHAARLRSFELTASVFAAGSAAHRPRA
jgi:alkanesulfonate monooxygenase SsuD/methylene tetrahydromethanopterin reductase-like flavin-dependent oxidoreductase (luciferase family)